MFRRITTDPTNAQGCESNDMPPDGFTITTQLDAIRPIRRCRNGDHSVREFVLAYLVAPRSPTFCTFSTTTHVKRPECKRWIRQTCSSASGSLTAVGSGDEIRPAWTS